MLAMPVAECFAADYAQARRKFVEAAQGAGAVLEHHAHPLRGPADESLFLDVALLGPSDAPTVAILSSGTHGVEGLAGSGCQVSLLRAGLGQAVRAGPHPLRLVLIHALNPWGFAWVRRVNEGNVDLNRNFVDHAHPYPENPHYAELADALCPTEWSEASLADANKRIADFGREHGAGALQAAVSGGQYSHPKGLFFGGHTPAWSNRTALALAARHLRGAELVGLVDFHTGLGPWAHGEIIVEDPPESRPYERACRWYGDGIRSTRGGTSVSAAVSGSFRSGLARALAHADFVGVGLEFGTLSLLEVVAALRADNWLHAHGEPGDLQAEPARSIKAQMHRAFYPDDDDWREQVVGRADVVVQQVLRGLTEP
jgi:hypothetical protein